MPHDHTTTQHSEDGITFKTLDQEHHKGEEAQSRVSELTCSKVVHHKATISLQPPSERESTNLIEEDDGVIGVVGTQDEVRIKVAFDTGAVANAMSPDDVPSNATMARNTTGKNFVGPSGETILNHGSCDTMLIGQHGKVGCKWKVADVTRPFHSGTQVTGPIDKPRQDVLINAGAVYVVEPCVVAKMVKSLKPVMEYKREGNLYLAEMAMTGFTRQGPAE
jgi:hypothetical protein